MKKRVILGLSLVILLIVSLSFVSAQNETETEGWEKAYDCLKDLVEQRGYNSLTPEEQAFSLLALGYDSSQQSSLKSALASSKDPNNACWPAGSCKLKETSLALFAYEHIGENTDDIESWLMNQTIAPRELIWYLQIDSPETVEVICNLSYRDTSRKITIKTDKKLSGSPGSCFRTAYNGYWLEVDDDCYNETFTISCDQSFVTALIYKRRTGSTYYVSTLTNTAPASGTTQEQVKTSCFKQGTSCDYEGSLWATLSLTKKGKAIKEFMPYLIALAPENSKNLPSSFLYMMTNYDEYLRELTALQRSDGYWQAVSTSDKFYDTALAISALSDTSSEAVDAAKDYLLEVIRPPSSSGCWQNSIRDTAFILYAAAQKPASSSGGTTKSYCEDFNHYCVAALECNESDLLPNFDCTSIGDVCCAAPGEPQGETCSDKQGIICGSDQSCTGTSVQSRDSNYCCLQGSCQDIVTECEEQNYVCKSTCSDDEEEKLYDCGSGETCCAIISTGGKSYWWIWLLVLLVILVALAIIFREKLKEQYLKLKTKMKKGKGGPSAPTRPGGMPPRPGMPPTRRPGMQMRRPQMRRPATNQAIRRIGNR